MIFADQVVVVAAAVSAVGTAASVVAVFAVAVAVVSVVAGLAVVGAVAAVVADAAGLNIAVAAVELSVEFAVAVASAAVPVAEHIVADDHGAAMVAAGVAVLAVAEDVQTELSAEPAVEHAAVPVSGGHGPRLAAAPKDETVSLAAERLWIDSKRHWSPGLPEGWGKPHFHPLRPREGWARSKKLLLRAGALYFFGAAAVPAAVAFAELEPRAETKMDSKTWPFDARLPGLLVHFLERRIVLKN